MGPQWKEYDQSCAAVSTLQLLEMACGWRKNLALHTRNMEPRTQNGKGLLTKAGVHFLGCEVAGEGKKFQGYSDVHVINELRSTWLDTFFCYHPVTGTRPRQDQWWSPQ